MYLSPRTSSAEVDLEGVICDSQRMFIQADELHNMNVGEGHDGPGSEHYFEF